MENKERAKFFSDKKIIGIDPGNSGGIAIYSLSKESFIEVVKMPETGKDILDFLRLYSRNSICFLEKVGGLPGMGGSAMFNFGKNYGHIEMALTALKIPNHEIIPQIWQKTLHIGTKGTQTTSVWKNKLKTKAQQIYPSVKLTLATSDAILIMDYGRKLINTK